MIYFYDKLLSYSYLNKLLTICILMLSLSCTKDDDTNNLPKFDLETPDLFADEDYEIYNLYLETFNTQKRIIKQKTRVDLAEYYRDTTEMAPYYREHFSQDYPELIVQIAESDDSLFFDQKFTVAEKEIYLITQNEIDYISKDALAKADPDNYNFFWDYFYEVHPNSQGYLWLSSIAYNDEKNEALFEYGNACGGLCGEGGFAYFKKENGLWKLIDYMVLVMS